MLNSFSENVRTETSEGVDVVTRQSADGKLSPETQNINATIAGEWWKIDRIAYEQLLGHVLDALDASLPNKQQHAAATRMVRNAFDKTYYGMMRLTYPEIGMGVVEGCYAVEPVR